MDKKNIHVFAGSVDTQDNARETVDKLELTFPMAYGLDREVMADRLGVFYNEEKGYLNSTNFILRPDGTVAEALYSTGPIGRFNVAEVVGMIDFWTEDK